MRIQPLLDCLDRYLLFLSLLLQDGNVFLKHMDLLIVVLDLELVLLSSQCAILFKFQLLLHKLLDPPLLFLLLLFLAFENPDNIHQLLISFHELLALIVEAVSKYVVIVLQRCHDFLVAELCYFQRAVEKCYLFSTGL